MTVAPRETEEDAYGSLEMEQSDTFMGFTGSFFPPLTSDSHRPGEILSLRSDISYGEAPILEPIDRQAILQVAWATVLSSYTHSDDVLFGQAISGRFTETGEQSIVPNRMRVRPTETVAAALTTAARSRLAMQPFEELGLEMISVLNPESAIACNFQNLLLISERSSEHETEFLKFAASCHLKYPLTVLCEYDERGFHFLATFNPTVLDPDTTHMILCQFAHAVGIAAKDPTLCVKYLQGICPEGLAKIDEWYKVPVSKGDTSCIVDLLQRRFTNEPMASAVCAWDGSLTYEDLDIWSSEISRQLVVAGVRPGTFVGVLMEKSMMAVVAMLAIIKAGAAFVLLPPSQPTSRLIHMCQRAKPRLVLSTPQQMVKGGELGFPLMKLERDFTENLKRPTRMTDGGFWMEANGHHPLYAIFTSGSTGEPKGVIVNRSSFGPGIQEFCIRSQLGIGSRIFQFASYSFIISIFEQLVSLAAGACICIPSDEEMNNDMVGAMRSLNANWAILATSVARSLDCNHISGMKTLLLVGEELREEDLVKWHRHVELHALYGQSESASTCLIQRLIRSSNVSSLGYPTTGVCWVVDPEDCNRLKPIGTEGELLIESPGIGNYYLNDEGQTASTFIRTPEWLQNKGTIHHGSRFLLTGDIVRYNADGSIHFVGRKGTRVKVRGQRVELGEIENHLRLEFHEAQYIIADIITPSGGNNMNPILAAFIFWPPEQGNEIRPKADSPDIFAPATTKHRQQARSAISRLRQSLPPFMVPQVIIPLKTYPRTATGKLYRKGLRETAFQLTLKDIMAYTVDKPTYRAPATNEELVMQSICQSLLSLLPGDIGMDDNFFDLGGDSLTARQLVTTGRSQGLCFTVANVFEEATLGDLAHCRESTTAKSNTAHIAGDVDPFALLKQHFMHNLPYSLPGDSIEDVHPTTELQSTLVEDHVLDYFPFQITGSLDESKLQHACEALVERHTILRSIFTKFRSQTLQIVLKHIHVPFDVVSLADGESPDVWARSFCVQDMKRELPMDQPTVKFVLVQSAQHRHILIVRLAHAQYDGSSLETLIKGLSEAYNGRSLEVLSDFSSYVRQCVRLRSPEAMSFWKDRLEGYAVTQLPSHIPDADVGQEMCAFFTKEVSHGPLPRGITMATAVKAAWSYVMRQETSDRNVLFGQVLNCRGIDLPGSRDIFGPCLNISPVQVSYDNPTTVRSLLYVIQRQHADSLEFDTIEWNDMVTNCTRETQGVQPGSVVIHENFNRNLSVKLGAAEFGLTSPIFTSPPWRTPWLTTFPEDGRLVSMLSVSNKAMSKQYAEKLLDSFSKTLMRFLDFPDSLVH